MDAAGHTPGSNAVDQGCQRVHAALREGRALEDDPALDAHRAACPPCAALAAGGAPLVGALAGEGLPAPVDAWLPALEAAVARERGPVAWLRSRPTATRTALAALGAGLVPLGVWLAWRRVDAAAYPAARLGLDVAVMAGSAALALVVAMRPLHRRAWPRLLAPVVVAVAAAAVLVAPSLPPAHADHPASLGGTGEGLVTHAMACLAVGVALGLPVLAWLGVLARGDRRTPWVPVATAGALAGLMGSLAVSLHCPLVAPAHLLAGHATVLVPFVLVGLVRRRLRPVGVG